jgi:hypothetical protein
VARFREPAAATDSAPVRFLETEGPATHLAISHNMSRPGQYVSEHAFVGE